MIRDFALEPWIGLEPPSLLSIPPEAAARWSRRQVAGSAMNGADARIASDNLMFTVRRISAAPREFAELLIDNCARCGTFGHWYSPTGGVAFWADGVLTGPETGVLDDVDSWLDALRSLAAGPGGVPVRFDYRHELWDIVPTQETVTIRMSHLSQRGEREWIIERSAFDRAALQFPALVARIRRLVRPSVEEILRPFWKEAEIQRWLDNALGTAAEELEP